MQETLTPAALELKRRGRRRLIGGATIALLMVVFLPMIFDSEPRREGSDKKEIALAVPAKEGQPPLPPPAPAVPAPKAQPAASEPAKTAAVASPAAPAKAEPKPQPPSAKTEQRPAQPAPAKSEAKVQAAQPAQPVADAKTKEGFAVQLGAFIDPENLKHLQAKMAAAKISVYTEELKSTSGTSTRLRAGPYKTREQAGKVLEQVKKAGVEGKVVTLP